MAEATPARRAFLQFIVAVAALHIGAIAAYSALGIAQKSAAQQRWFAWTWIGLTAALVFAGLQRIKRARRAR